jgi:hypothetical protein
MVVHADAELTHVVLALGAARGLAGGLHRREEQRHEHADDRNRNQQLDERESAPRVRS